MRIAIKIVVLISIIKLVWMHEDDSFNLNSIRSNPQYTSVSGDIYDKWIKIAIQVTKDGYLSPGDAARIIAIVATVIYRAPILVLNTHKFESLYQTNMNAIVSYSVNVAGYTALTTQFSFDRSYIDSCYLSALKNLNMTSINDTIDELHYFVTKQTVQYLKSRLFDGANEYSPYTLLKGSQYWKPTENGVKQPYTPQYRYVEPFLMNDLSEFIPYKPYNLNSTRFQEDCNEVRIEGSNKIYNTTNKEIALFWNNNPITPTGHWLKNVALGLYKSYFSLDFLKRSLAIKLTCQALADATFLSFRTIYTYNFPRPYTLITSGVCKPNDTIFMPYISTPPYPEYISIHIVVGGTAAKVIGNFIGTDSLTFKIISDDYPGVTRTFYSLTAAAKENALSRIYSGHCFRTNTLEALKVGYEFGKAVVSKIEAKYKLF